MAGGFAKVLAIRASVVRMRVRSMFSNSDGLIRKKY